MTNKLNGFDADDHRFRIRGYQQIASSITGALMTSLFMTPLDVVKTRLQVQDKLLLSNKCYLYCNGLMDHLCPCGPTPNPQNIQRFNGTIDAFVKITRNEGLHTLWSGLSPTLVLAIPTTVLYFVSYEQLRVRLKDMHMARTNQNPDDYKIPLWIPLLAGSSARIFAVTIVNPLELIRTKMQSEKMSYREVGTAFNKMLKQHGFRGLFKGLTPTIMRDAPFSAIYWTCYESYKKFHNTSNPDLLQSFVGGAVAGTLAALITCPFDVIKTHQQIEFGERFLYYTNNNNNNNGGNGAVRKKQMSSTHQTIRNILNTSGYRGFYSGIIPRLAKVAPACAIMISTYEYGKKFFHSYNVQVYYQKNPELRKLS